MSTPKTALDLLSGWSTVTGAVSTVGGNANTPAALAQLKEVVQQPGGVKLPTVFAPK